MTKRKSLKWLSEKTKYLSITEKKGQTILIFRNKDGKKIAELIPNGEDQCLYDRHGFSFKEHV